LTKNNFALCFAMLTMLLSLAGCGASATDKDAVAAEAAKAVFEVAPGVKRPTYSVGGTLIGLAAGHSIKVRLNDHLGRGNHSTVLSSNGPFSLGQLRFESEYQAILSQIPAGHDCEISSSEGLVRTDVTNINIQCSARQFALTGTVSGTKAKLVLVNQATGEQIVVPAGTTTFAFKQMAQVGQPFDIQILLAEDDDNCRVLNGNGIDQTNLSGLQVICSPPQVAVPSVPLGLGVDVEIKNYTFTWNPSVATNYYELAEDPDGSGPQPEAVIGNNLSDNRFSYPIKALLPSRLNAQYRVRACNEGGCSAYSALVTPDVSRAIGYLKASNSRANLNLGFFSLAISADGSTLVVGTSDESSNSTGINGTQTDASLPFAGAAYVFVRSNNRWSQQAYIKASNTASNSFFGVSVALSSDGNTLAVGASSEASNATGVDGDQTNSAAPGAGAVYVFKRNNGNWSQQAYLKASNTRADSGFGVQVTLSADASTLAVGAWTESSRATGINGAQTDTTAPNAGAVYVFTQESNNTWAQQAYVKPSNTQAELRFGQRVALSASGNTMAIGSSRESSNATGVNANQNDLSSSEAGAVYIYTRRQATWQQEAYLKASNTNASNTGVGDRFGIAVTLSADGNTLAVGAWGEDSNSSGIDTNQSNELAQDAGAVYVFSRNNQTWNQQAYVKASNAKAGDRFGTRVVLSADGNTMAVGAQAEDSGGSGVGAQGSNPSPQIDSGAVYIFNRQQGLWRQNSVIKASVPRANAGFGWGIALAADGSTLAVGAPGESSNAIGIGGNQGDSSAFNAGALYIF
jgi:hypothetical protein